MRYKINNFSSFQIISPVLLILYLCVGFIPNMEAVDKIAPQWLVMTILNIISISIFLFNKNLLSKIISPILYSSISVTYLGFILWAGASYFYAINPTEVIVNITRQFNVFIMFLSMCILLYDFKQKSFFISWVLTIILSIEVYYVLNQLFDLLQLTDNISQRSSLKGVAANPNITAFSIVNKIPFLIFLLFQSKKESLKIFLSFLLIASLISISSIQSRASFLAVGLIYFFSLTILIFFKEGKKLKKQIILGLYLLLPLFISIGINQTFLASKGADVIKRAGTISLNKANASIGARLRYYSHVIEQVKEAPFFGVGLGNWKFKSIKYDSKDIKGYVVPYHAHSDFIQLGAELGIIGFLLYLGIFIWATYYVYLLIRNSNYTSEKKIFFFLLLTALGSYTIDANLNFPIARPQVLVILTIIFSLITTYFLNKRNKSDNSRENKRINLLFLILGLLTLIPSLSIANSVYKSLKGQMFLLQDFNSNKYTIPLSQIDNIVPDIPNVTVTTIPINSIKARYYLNLKKYDKALELLDNSSKANPYLFYSEILKSQIFQEKGELDSAKFYARKAFFGLPNNDLHSTRYINLINMTKDRKALEESFELLTANNKLVNRKNYLIIASGISPPGDKSLVEKARYATQIFPNNAEIKGLYRQITIGRDALNKSNNFSLKGLKYFELKQYDKAAVEFEKAIEINPLDYAYFENAATANYLIGNYEKALEQINTVIEKLNPLNGKCEYIKALIFIKLGDPIGACPLLETSKRSGYKESIAISNQYCI